MRRARVFWAEIVRQYDKSGLTQEAFATQRGIPVANVPDYGTEDVADTAIGTDVPDAGAVADVCESVQEHGTPCWVTVCVRPAARIVPTRATDEPLAS